MANTIVESAGPLTRRLRFASDQAPILAQVESADLVAELDGFFEFVTRYVEHGHRIDPGRALSYGFWPVVFKRTESGLAAWERDPSGTRWRLGITYAVEMRKEQSRVCEAAGAAFRPPSAGQLCAISRGVLEGVPVQAVRYETDRRMSGWWMTTSEYNGDPSTLRHEHLYHVTAAQPSLAAYLALPEGFRFHYPPDRPPWFDDRVAESSARARSRQTS
jgi:hypothetical protein